MSKPTHMIGDCLGVVNAIGKLAMNPHPTSVHGGLLRDAVRQDRIKFVTESSWMPSHRALKSDATDAEKLWHASNDLVDKAAGKAREEAEARAGTEVLKDARIRYDMAKSILKAVGSILAVYPPLPRSVSRLETNPKGALSVTHDWHYVAKREYWKCSCCGIFCKRPREEGPPPKASWCRPGRNQERATEAERLGHALKSILVQGVPTIYCDRCGVHGTRQWHGLLSVCHDPPRNVNARTWLAQAQAGR